MICLTCSANRGMTLPANPIWLAGLCSICRQSTSVADPLELDHHTGAVVPEDTGGEDGID